MILIFFYLMSCAQSNPDNNNGWKETEAPRSDLQCWRRWNRDESTVCAQSLTLTHGASNGTN